MDARLDAVLSLGVAQGDAQIVRNAGGVATDDVIRSLVISQRLIGTTEIVLIHHTDCGMLKFAEGELVAAVEADSGIRPWFTFGAFTDLEADLRRSAQRIRTCGIVPHVDAITGYVFEVETGLLRPVDLGS